MGEQEPQQEPTRVDIELEQLVERAQVALGGSDSGAEQLNRLSVIARFRDEETAEHVERVGRSCALTASVLGWEEGRCKQIQLAATLHDIGKVAIPDNVLRKPGPLTPLDRKLIETHTEIGYEILSGSNDPLVELAATIALTHHECPDGGGYPQGLKADKIPLPGRIAAVADVYDALTHERVYREAFEPEVALRTVRDGKGTQFDSEVLEAFHEAHDDIAELRERFPNQQLRHDEADALEEARPVSVLIVEDHNAVARGLALLLRSQGMEVAGVAGNLAAARALIERRRAEVMIVDVDLDGESGIDLLDQADKLGAGVLLYTGHADAKTLREAEQSAALGVATKAGSPLELIAGVRAVANGERYLDPRLASLVERLPTEGPGLTGRQLEIVQLLADGLTGEQIAEKLFLSPETVRTHVRNAMNRLGARTRGQLVGLAASRGDITLGE